MYASLNRAWSIGRRPSRTWIIDAWLSAASSLWVDCVENIVGLLASCSLGSPCIAKRPA
jgi:hypothetical protein